MYIPFSCNFNYSKTLSCKWIPDCLTMQDVYIIGIYLIATLYWLDARLITVIQHRISRNITHVEQERNIIIIIIKSIAIYWTIQPMLIRNNNSYTHCSVCTHVINNTYISTVVSHEDLVTSVLVEVLVEYNSKEVFI